MSVWLKYTVLYSDFQPSTKNVGTFALSLAPKGSFLQNIKVSANTCFSGGAATACTVKASFHNGTYNVYNSLDAFNHPYILPVPPIPQSRTVLINDLSTQKIKISISVTGDIINNLSAGAVDIYFQLNEVLYPYKLDLIFKQPVGVFSLNHLLSQFAGNMLRLERVTDGNLAWFGFADFFIDNAAIIVWLGGSACRFRTLVNQAGGGINLRQLAVVNRPVYDPLTSLFTFDGINDWIQFTGIYDLINFFLSVRSSIDAGHIIGHAATIQSGVVRTATTVFFRNRLSQFTYNINSAGFKKTFLNSNNLHVSCLVDNVEAANSPNLFGALQFQFNQLGARVAGNWFSGTFDELIIYDSPLSNSEMLIINSI